MLALKFGRVDWGLIVSIQHYRSELTNDWIQYDANLRLDRPSLRTLVPGAPVTVVRGRATTSVDGSPTEGDVVVEIRWSPSPSYVVYFEFDVGEPSDGWPQGAPVNVVFLSATTSTGESVAVDTMKLTIRDSYFQYTLIGPNRLCGSGTVAAIQWTGSSEPPVAVRFSFPNVFLPLSDTRQVCLHRKNTAGPIVEFKQVSLEAAVDQYHVVFESLAPWNAIDQLALVDQEGADEADVGARVNGWYGEESFVRYDQIWSRPQGVPPGSVVSMCAEVRSSAGTFTAKDRDLWELTLQWFVVLATGTANWPVCIEEVDSQRQVSRVALRPLTVSSSRALASWWPRDGATSETVAVALSTLKAIVDDSYSRGWLELIATWYVSAIETHDHRNRLVVAQTALELLAWVHLVVDRNMSGDGFEKLAAADKIRLFLQSRQVSLELPATMRSLQQLAHERDAASPASYDAPLAVVEARNRVVHPPRRRRDEFAGRTERFVEAADLALHLLEGSIERTLGWSGPTYDRTAP